MLDTDKGRIRLLIDTGSNLNFINKAHTIRKKWKKFQKEKVFTSANGGKTSVKSYINFDPFKIKSQSESARQFLIYNVNENFDGLIGYDYLTEAKAIIDTSRNVLILPDREIKMQKQFPSKKVRINAKSTKACTFTCNQKEGDFYISEDTEICPSITIQGGLYSAQNYECLLVVKNDTEQHASLKFPYAKISRMQNFVEIDTQDVNTKELNFENCLRLSHLNDEEKFELLKVIKNNKNAFHNPSESLTFTSAIKHKITTHDNDPVYTKKFTF